MTSISGWRLLRQISVAAGIMAPVVSAGAGDMLLSSATTGGSEVRPRISSYIERKFHNTLRQQADFSCGSAALATLLTFHYGQQVAEREVLTDMIAHGDRKTIETQGFSMLDMKEYLARRGLQSNGFRLPLDKIAQVRVPGIILVNHNGYNHFAVLEGLSDGRVLLADPALGKRAMDAEAFQKEWNGVLFLILNGADAAQQQFNLVENWSIQPRASWSELRDLYALSQLSFHNGRNF
jgi:predicted double-glycine peptidase